MSHQIDSLDRKIIRALQLNGRKSNVDVAREVGVTEATIRKRLDRLLTEEILHITACPNLSRVGLSTSALIAFQVDLGLIGQVAERLCSLPHVRSVRYTTGEYDLFAEVVVLDDEDLLRLLTFEIANIEGVHKTSTFHILKRIKEEHHWVLPGPSKPGILIVDDDPDFVEIARIVLEREGFEVVSASHGDEALEAVQQFSPALIIMDVMMRGILDGLHTSWQIRADPGFHNIPILMISSITSSEYAEMFPTDESIPIDNFLSKPVSPEKLIWEVDRLLQRNE